MIINTCNFIYVSHISCLLGPVRRMPLTQCIHEIVCEWSDGFLQMAKESDPAAQFLVAQS